MIVLVMGVAGSGKSTVGAALAATLGWKLAEGDDFHPPENVAKMAAGVPLDDEDRVSWLASIAAWIAERVAAREDAVVVCSALKRAYRDRLRAADPAMRVVYLEGAPELLAARLAARAGHFFRAEMLGSQLAVLEAPAADERPIVVAIDAPRETIVARIVDALGARP